jgi:hypothetical protein
MVPPRRATRFRATRLCCGDIVRVARLLWTQLVDGQRGGGCLGSDGFLILSPVTLDAGGTTGMAVSDE